MTPSQERARETILGHVEAEVDRITREATERAKRERDAWTARNRCRDSDMPEAVVRRIVDPIRAWVREEVERVALEAVAKASAVGLDAEALIKTLVGRAR